MHDAGDALFCQTHGQQRPVPCLLGTAPSQLCEGSSLPLHSQVPAGPQGPVLLLPSREPLQGGGPCACLRGGQGGLHTGEEGDLTSRMLESSPKGNCPWAAGKARDVYKPHRPGAGGPCSAPSCCRHGPQSCKPGCTRGVLRQAPAVNQAAVATLPLPGACRVEGKATAPSAWSWARPMQGPNG